MQFLFMKYTIVYILSRGHQNMDTFSLQNIGHLTTVKMKLISHNQFSVSPANMFPVHYHNRRVSQKDTQYTNIRHGIKVTNPSHTSVILTFHSPVETFLNQKTGTNVSIFRSLVLFITLSCNYKFTISGSLHRWFPTFFPCPNNAQIHSLCFDKLLLCTIITPSSC